MNVGRESNGIDFGRHKKKDARGGPTTHFARQVGIGTPPGKLAWSGFPCSSSKMLVMASTQIANITGRNPNWLKYSQRKKHQQINFMPLAQKTSLEAI